MARIIAIEDSPALQRLLEIALRGTGIEVESHLDGAFGLEASIADPPDLIILDLGLPTLSGWDVLDRLRSDPGTAQTPVVLTTGDVRGSVADRATTYGAVTLEKPYTGAVLRSTVLLLLEMRPVAQSSS